MTRHMNWMTACLMVFLAACGEEHTEASLAEDACEHMLEGPSEAITAVASDATDAAPAIEEEHTRYDITLVDENGVDGGNVDLLIAEEGEHVLFLSAGVALTVTDSAGNGVMAEAMQSDVPECNEVAASYTFDLGVGTYALGFESAQETMVQVVMIPAGTEYGHE